MSQYGCDPTEQVRIPLSPTRTNGHPDVLDSLTAVVVPGGGDATFVVTSPSEIIFRSGTALAETFFDVTGTAGGVSVTERHSLLVSDAPLGALGLAQPANAIIEPKPAPTTS